MTKDAPAYLKGLVAAIDGLPKDATYFLVVARPDQENYYVLHNVADHKVLGASLRKIANNLGADA